MKKCFFLRLLLFLPLLFYAQDDRITRELQPFQEIKAFDGISVELVRSNENRAIITGENTAKVVIVNNKGVLKIRMKIDKLFSGYKTFVTLFYAQDLTLIDVNEDALIFSEDVLEQDILDIRAQEGGELRLNCKTEQLLAKAVTGGSIDLKGSTHNQDIVINTGGRFQGQEFVSSFTTISVNAGGSALVHATNYVKANVKAGGSVKVYGDPKKMDEKTVFGGTIERIE